VLVILGVNVAGDFVRYKKLKHDRLTDYNETLHLFTSNDDNV